MVKILQKFSKLLYKISFLVELTKREEVQKMKEGEGEGDQPEKPQDEPAKPADGGGNGGDQPSE